MMTEERGTHFDPSLLDVFLSDLDALEAIQHRYRDESLSAV